MFQKSSVVNSTTGSNNTAKPDPDPYLNSASGGSGCGSASNYNKERITLPSFKDKQYVNYLNSNRPKEESKSQSTHRLRNTNSHSSAQQSHIVHSSSPPTSSPATTTTTANQQEIVNQTNRNSSHQSFNQRIGNNSNQFVRSSTNPQIYQNPNLQSQRQDINNLEQQHPSQTTRLFNSTQVADSPSSFNQPRASQTYSSRQRSPSTSTLRDELRASHNLRQDQQDRADDMVTVIREELEELADAFKDSELETLGSLEKDLPVELSFLIRQQAYCMARMNYLDRQIRELKEAKHNVPHQQPANQQQHLYQQRAHGATATATHIKHGHGFIPSDDSGGEYSRATISDEDELSSLLDQIAKSVRPERGNMSQSMSVNQHQLLQQHQLNSRANYSVISSQPQQYAIINPGQLHATHHQAATAVPVFVMGSPIAVAHPSSISSNILPGVHFQPEPRYNQYYEDFYSQNNNGIISSSNNNSGSTTHSMMNTRQINGIPHLRPQPNTSQFDTSISAIEQLVNQKERRQIRSQLKSADNWLKMRSSNTRNLNEDFSSEKRETNEGQAGGQGTHEQSKSHMMSSSGSTNVENPTNVIQGNENNR